MRSVLSSLAVIAAFSLSAAPALAAPAGSSPSFALRSYETTDASTSSPFKRLLTSDICAKIDLVLTHQIYACTSQGGGVVASDYIQSTDANVQHGIQSSAGGGPNYVDQKMNPPINPLAPPIGADDTTFIGGQQGGNNFPGGDGTTFTGPPESPVVLGVGKTPNTKRISPYDAIPGGDSCTLSKTETLTLKVGVCICITDGHLTKAAIKAITDAVNDPANAQIISALTTTTSGHQDFPNVQAIIDYLEQYALNTVGSQTTKCVYPENSVPDSCDNCHYHCHKNHYLCGNKCIPDSQDCQSDMPVVTRKRDFLSGPDVKCPSHLTACGIPATSFFTGRNFECIDTSSNIESCGACAFPLPGQPFGVDCTAIPHSTGVSCHFGQCVVDTCERGFELNAESTGCVISDKRSIYDSRRTTREAYKSRQVTADSLRAKGRN